MTSLGIIRKTLIPSILGSCIEISIPRLSAQSLEWNDEATEEQGGTESPPVVTDDVSAQNSEKKEDNVVGTEENEWDKLLRVR